MKPVVTILCTTYNHEKYIKQALDGFLNQITNFPFEIIVHDDASTDSTQSILKEYQKNYPDKIKLILQNDNQFSQGKDILFDFMYEYIEGKYVAINEGDDYWIDCYKLQKQVDFLETNPDYSLCFHPVNVEWEDKAIPAYKFPSDKFINNNEFNYNSLKKENYIQTNSVLYRWSINKEDWPKLQVLPCDHLWHLFHARQGKIGFIEETMSVYRRNSGGIWTGFGKSEKWYINYGIPFLRYLRFLKSEFDVGTEKFFSDTFLRVFYHLLYAGEIDRVKSLLTEFNTDAKSLFTLDSFFGKDKKIRKLKKIIIVESILFLILLIVVTSCIA